MDEPTKHPVKNGTAKPLGENDFVRFNISGQVFVVCKDLLHKNPESKLASLHQFDKHWVEGMDAYYFDRDPALFNAVLNIFRYDNFNAPPGYNDSMIRNELSFWNLESAGIFSPDDQSLEEEFLWMEGRVPPPAGSATSWQKVKFNVWNFMTDPIGPYTSYTKLSLTYSITVIVLTFLYMLVFGMSTSLSFREPVDGINTTNGQVVCDYKIGCILKTQPTTWVTVTMIILMVLFMLETFVKLVFCPDYNVYFKSVVNWIDLLASLSALISVIINADGVRPAPLTQSWAITLYVLQGIQILRIFKIFQYVTVMDGLMVLLLTLKASVKELLVLFVYLIMAMFLFSALITIMEITQPVDTGVSDCLTGYWWAIVTMTTVGYGDYYPKSSLGHVIGVLCAVAGVIMVALPVAVIGNNFSIYWDYNSKRKTQRKIRSNSKVAVVELTATNFE